MLSCQELVKLWRIGMRNGNCRRLGLMERIFYKAAMCYARMKTKITNSKITAKLRGISEKLRATVSKRIVNLGKERVKEMLMRFKENGVLKWAPQLEIWFSDQNYVFWLGLSAQIPYCVTTRSGDS